jgi:predicted nuclease of predicted toxin-antitoxin system
MTGRQMGSEPVRFFPDHDVPVEVSRVLRHEGHEVTELREVLPVRANDVEVFNYVCEHGLILRVRIVT